MSKKTILLIGVIIILVSVMVLQSIIISEHRMDEAYFSLIESELCIFQLSLGIDCDTPFLLASDVYYDRIRNQELVAHDKMMYNQPQRYCEGMHGTWDPSTNICTDLGWKFCRLVDGQALERDGLFGPESCLILN